MGKAGGPVAPNDERDSGKEHRKLTAHLSFSARHPNTKSLPASETAVAPEPAAAVSFLQGSRWFAPLDATPSLHSRAVKQGHVYIGEAEETLADPAAFPPGCTP